MKFITEEDLRDLYRKETFSEYEVETGTRITPGARQFLSDRQITLYDTENPRKKQEAKQAQKEDIYSSPDAVNPDVCNRKLFGRIKSLEAMFLTVAEELLGRDILLAQKVISLKKSFADIKNIFEGGVPCSPLACESCTWITEENFSQDLGDCFEITEFHIQLSKGKEIIQMHRLRCSLRELEFDILEFLDRNSESGKQCEEMIDNLHKIINTISQMICSAAGGEKCQRKN